MPCVVPNHFFGTCFHHCGRMLLVLRDDSNCKFYPVIVEGHEELQGDPLSKCPHCGEVLCFGNHRFCKVCEAHPY